MNPNLLRVCSFESRRSEEMFRLIERSQGLPFNAPSMREIELSDNTAAFEFADQLLRGEIDLVIFMTGVGTETLFSALATRGQDQVIVPALQSCLTLVRGPKPFAVLAQRGVKVNLRAPEPNTWNEIITELERNQVELSGKRVAVQEYGEPSHQLYAWLESQGAEVLPVPVYQWALPVDLQPLRSAIQSTIHGEFDVILWTSAQQLNHVLQVADSIGRQADWLAAANRCVIGSIGPTASERLRSLGLPPDLEPSHPKMGHLIRETLEQAPDILKHKTGNA